MTGFTADWLALREPADQAARDPARARRFAAALKRPARLVDLGAGTGANARALAPVIAGAQAWVLVDSDPALIAAQDTSFAGWEGREWRRSGLALDLADGWAALDALALDGVTCSALLDLASLAWLARLADWLAARRLPFLAALSVDGRRLWAPAAPEDAAIGAAFRRHQQRDKGLGPALGGAAAVALAGLLRDRSFVVTMAASDWRLGPGPLLAALVRGEAEAAAVAMPGDAALFATWRDRRLGQVAAGALGLTVGHSDLLALPAEICGNPGSGRGRGDGAYNRRRPAERVAGGETA
jgi:hypothetical protein